VVEEIDEMLKVDLKYSIYQDLASIDSALEMTEKFIMVPFEEDQQRVERLYQKISNYLELKIDSIIEKSVVEVLEELSKFHRKFFKNKGFVQIARNYIEKAMEKFEKSTEKDKLIGSQIKIRLKKIEEYEVFLTSLSTS